MLKPINISQGTLPNTDIQVSNPRLKEAFVTAESHIQPLPNLTQEIALSDVRAVYRSTITSDLFAVASGDFLKIDGSQAVNIASIGQTNLAIRIAENAQGQIVIVDGVRAYAYDQNSQSFEVLGLQNGFDFTEAVDVTELNTFIIIVGKIGQESRWIVSTANNAFTYNGQEVVLTDNSLGELTGVEHWNNNLFIFGLQGVQRWIPSIERTTFDFPFSQDPSFRDELGCISTASLVSENNRMFFLTENGQVKVYDKEKGQGIITNDGLEKLFTSYNTAKAQGSYFYFEGYYFYILSFINDNISFVYCPKTNKWSETNQLWVGYQTRSVRGDVALKDGIYSLTDDYSGGKQITIQTDYFYLSKQLTDRAILSEIILNITQGKGETNKTEKAFLSISKDNILYGNSVSRNLSKTAERLRQLKWNHTVSNYGVSLRFELSIFTNLTIINCLGRR